MSLGAVRWCWLYYFVKAGQGYVPKEGGKCRSGRFLWTRVVKPSHQHRRPLWQCCSSAGKLPRKHFWNAKFFDNIYFISDAEFLIAAAAGRNKEMQFHLSETLPYTDRPTHLEYWPELQSVWLEWCFWPRQAKSSCCWYAKHADLFWGGTPRDMWTPITISRLGF